MSLAVEVGSLVRALNGGDADERKAARHDLREINRLLTANKLPLFFSPTTSPLT